MMFFHILGLIIRRPLHRYLFLSFTIYHFHHAFIVLRTSCSIILVLLLIILLLVLLYFPSKPIPTMSTFKILETLFSLSCHFQLFSSALFCFVSREQIQSIHRLYPIFTHLSFHQNSIQFDCSCLTVKVDDYESLFYVIPRKEQHTSPFVANCCFSVFTQICSQFRSTCLLDFNTT